MGKRKNEGERVTVTCDFCGRKSLVLKCRTKNGRSKYCSKECANKAKVRSEIVNCEVCGKPFQKKRSNPGRRFCSKKCMGIAQRGHTRREKDGRILRCDYCGRPFYSQKSRLDTSRFCSKYCQIQYFVPNRSGEKSPTYKGGIGIRRRKGSELGYQILRGTKDQIPLHRKIASDILGRGLNSDEVVHHIDGNGLNNSHDNLLVCSAAYHAMLHHRMQGGGRLGQVTRS